MNVEINARKKEITLKAIGQETDMFALIVAFAGDAVLKPKLSTNLLSTLMSKTINTLVIDMNHPSITKQFIQLLLRNNSTKIKML